MEEYEGTRFNLNKKYNLFSFFLICFINKAYIIYNYEVLKWLLCFYTSDMPIRSERKIWIVYYSFFWVLVVDELLRPNLPFPRSSSVSMTYTLPEIVYW